MKMKSRCHRVMVTSHEKLLLVFYRSLPSGEQLDVDGLMALWWRLPGVGARWKHEGDTLRIGKLTANHIAPFMDASKRVAGVSRRDA